MKKKTGLVVVSVLLVVFLLGCVSKSTYGQVVQERDDLNQQLQSRTAERDSAQQTLNTTLAELANTKTERDNVQRDLASAQRELAKAQAQRDGANEQMVALQADLTRSQSNATSARQSYETLRARAEKAQRYYNVAEAYMRLSLANIKDSRQDWLQAYGETSAMVMASADQSLKDAWGEVTRRLVAGAPEDEIGKFDLAFMELLAKRLAGEAGNGGVLR